MRSTFLALVLAASTGTAFAGDDERLAGDPPAQDDLAKAADATADVANMPGDPDTLAKAADATADVAAVAPPAGAATPAAVKPSSDDIDLSALGLDPGASAFDDKLNLYGFADFGFTTSHWNKDIPTIPKDAKSFAIGNLNVYLARSLTPKARALLEVRFTFLPNGSTNINGTSVDSTANDPTNFSRPVQWGGVVIERAYVEYDVSEHLTVRAGHWLTPYGIWNIDHGSPVIIATVRPYIIGEQFFPEHQTGLDLYGSHTSKGFKLGYHLTGSNGRGGSEAQIDTDNKLAFGGRLELETPWGLKLGGSYYRGRYTALTTVAGQMPQSFLEAAYGADAQFDRGPLHVQGEVIVREHHYTDGNRMAGPAGFMPDGRDLGFYALAGYRFTELWNAMPFFVHEDYRPADHSIFERVQGDSLGLNFRPAPSLVLKVAGSYVLFPGNQGLLGHATFWEISSQASWVF
jgi:hypothetical protein